MPRGRTAVLLLNGPAERSLDNLLVDWVIVPDGEEWELRPALGGDCAMWCRAGDAPVSSIDELRDLLRQRLRIGRERAIDAFRRLDLDGDGRLSRDEYQTALKALQIVAPAHLVRGLFDELSSGA